jgi:endonuclease/exonuclease/phosphatase family metal-dependent hydrolase
MTWNVENLFLPKIDSSIEDVTQFAFKLNLLANVIRQFDPDVVGLQEVGGEEPLLELQVTLNDVYPNRIVSAFPDGRGIRVAFLSKLEVTKVEDIADFPPGPATQIFREGPGGQIMPVTRMGRGALFIRVENESLSINLINLHLKSKLLTYRTPSGRTSFQPPNEDARAQAAGIALHRRTAEAITVRKRVNQLVENQTGKPLVLLGDFNDVPDAQTSLLFTGPTGSGIGTRGFNRADAGDDARLFNLAPLIPEERRYSRVHHGRGELLDQIFASEELFPRDALGRRTLPFVDSLVNFHGALDSIADNPNLRKDEIPPDHAPVVAAFEL